MELTVAMLETAIKTFDLDFFENPVIVDCLYDYLDTYCETLYHMDDIEEVLSDMGAFECFLVGRNSEFNLNDEYFDFNAYGLIESYTSMRDYFDKKIDLSDFVRVWYEAEWNEVE